MVVGVDQGAARASDNALAQRVVSDDAIMDAKQRELDDRAITLIAKRQPMAHDLREVVGAIRMAADLERIGDLAKNIAKRVERGRPDDARRASCRIRHRAHGGAGARPAQGRARRLCRARRRQALSRAGADDEQIDVHVHVAVPRAADLHDGRPAQHHGRARICCSAPRTSSASATTSTNIAENVYYVLTGTQLPANGRSSTRRP